MSPRGCLLVTGASGLLGANLSRIALVRGYHVIAASHHERLPLEGLESVQVDLTQPGAAAELAYSTHADWIVHCAAVTNLDWCEEHPEEARLVNTEVPRRLAEAARICGSRFTQISTDGVFDGMTGGYRENDPARPLNIYGHSKLNAERAVRSELPEALIVRTNLYGWNFQRKHSLAEWILQRLEAGQRVTAFADVLANPLFVDDLAELLLEAMERELCGTYHLAASDQCTKFEFAQSIAREFGFDQSSIISVKSDEVGLRAARPRKQWLHAGKVTADLGHGMPLIREGVERFHARRGVFEQNFTQKA